jgi:hypothetical protein
MLKKMTENVEFVLGRFLTSPLAPRGEICPLGGMFTPSFTPGVNRKFLPQGITSPPGNKIHP